MLFWHEMNIFLFSVVKHIGNRAAGGHYVADIYHQSLGEWVHYDDNNVHVVSLPQVFKFRHPRVPYLLYYRRADLSWWSPPSLFVFFIAEHFVTRKNVITVVQITAPATSFIAQYWKPDLYNFSIPSVNKVSVVRIILYISQKHSSCLRFLLNVCVCVCVRSLYI